MLPNSNQNSIALPSFTARLPFDWPDDFTRQAARTSSDQPARDDLRLNLRCALENVEDARVAEDAGDRVFEREAVADEDGR